MNTHLLDTVIFGLAASLCWVSGDFSGGLASRRASAGSVVLTDYAVGYMTSRSRIIHCTPPLSLDKQSS